MQQQVSELDILKILNKKFNGVSTNIKNNILEYLGPISYEPYALRNYKMTMQTVIVELSGISIQDFDITYDSVQSAVNQNIPYKLLKISSKKCNVEINGKNINIVNNLLVKNQMNASLEFVFQSLKLKDKQYKLRLFTNGMLQIPGVTECYSMSEVPQLIQSLIQYCQILYPKYKQISYISHSVALCNFTSNIGLINQNINTVKIYNDYIQQPNTFVNLCKQQDLDCIELKIGKTRSVLSIKFQIQKHKQQFTNYNPSSTTNRRLIHSIMFQVTKSGIVMISGSTGDFNITSQVIDKFNEVLKEFIPQYLINV